MTPAKLSHNKSQHDGAGVIVTSVHTTTHKQMRIRTTSQLAKHARWAVFNIQTDEVVELHTTRKAAQSACDEMHAYAGVTNWMRVGRNPAFVAALPSGTDLMMLCN